MKKIAKEYKLKDLQNPQYIKQAKENQLPLMADDFRSLIIESVADNGGHLSSNLGNVELTMAIHRFFDLPKDKLIFDVGHQSYTHKIMTGRDLSHLRQKDGVSGFQNRDESPFDCYEAGHSSTSLSAALGMAIARDMDHQNYNVIALIGDGSIASGLSFEALNDIGASKHKVIIIVNDNSMSISKPVGALSTFFERIKNKFNYGNRHTKTSEHNWYANYIFKQNAKLHDTFKKQSIKRNFFTDLNLKYIGPVNGHSFLDLEESFKLAIKAKDSCVIHVQTVKGKGYKFAEEDKTGYWHGVEPFDIKTGKPLSRNSSSTTWCHYFANLTYKNMVQNEQIVVISPAMMLGSDLGNIFADFPNRTFDVGIAEEHALTMASGLACNGKHPVVCIYSTFLQRALDELNHDLCRMNLNSTLLIDRSGLVGHDGETHQGIYDEAYLVSTPNLTLTMPSNTFEADALYSMSLEGHGVFAIKYPRDNINSYEECSTKPLQYGKWECLHESQDNKLAVISVGPMIHKLDEELTNNGIDATIINAIFIKPFDKEMLNVLKQYENIIIYNPYATKYGLVNEIESYLIENQYQGKIVSYCVPDTFIAHASIQEQIKDNNLSPEQIVNKIKELGK